MYSIRYASDVKTFGSGGDVKTFGSGGDVKTFGSGGDVKTFGSRGDVKTFGSEGDMQTFGSGVPLPRASGVPSLAQPSRPAPRPTTRALAREDTASSCWSVPVGWRGRSLASSRSVTSAAPPAKWNVLFCTPYYTPYFYLVPIFCTFCFV